MLQDGMCSSACGIFAELLKTQGKVEVVAMGGMPSLAPMQAIGGTKGNFVFSTMQLNGLAAGFYQSAIQSLGKVAEELDQTALGSLVKAQLPIIRSWDGEKALSNVNPYDNLRKGDVTETPLEFIYEAADCRLFYEPKMLFDATATWKAVHDAKWLTNYASCVPGSTGHPSSLSGGALINPIVGEGLVHPPVTDSNSTSNSTFSPGTPGESAQSTGGAQELLPWSGSTLMISSLMVLLACLP